MTFNIIPIWQPSLLFEELFSYRIPNQTIYFVMEVSMLHVLLKLESVQLTYIYEPYFSWPNVSVEATLFQSCDYT